MDETFFQKTVGRICNFVHSICEQANAKYDEMKSDPAVISSDNTEYAAQAAQNKGSRSKSIIAADMVIEGSIASASDIVVNGTVHGDVTSAGNVHVHGNVTGNIKGRAIVITNASITGNLEAEDKFFVSTSDINGNICAATGEVDCKITGNIKTQGALSIKKAANITGDITASVITVEENAVIDGGVTVRTA